MEHKQRRGRKAYEVHEGEEVDKEELRPDIGASCPLVAARTDDSQGSEAAYSTRADIATSDDEPVGATSLAIFATQELEQELADRKRKRHLMDDAVDLSRRKSNRSATQSSATAHQVDHDLESRIASTLQPHDNCFLPPPSGGAASSATQSLALYSPPFSAEGAIHEGPVDRSLSPSPPLSPIFSEIQPHAPADVPADSFPMDILTQDWMDFLDSSQAGEARNLPAGPVAGVPARLRLALTSTTMGDSFSRTDRLFTGIDSHKEPASKGEDVTEGAELKVDMLDAPLAKLCIACGTPLQFNDEVRCMPMCLEAHIEEDLKRCIQGFGLCEQQARALRLAASGRNVFLTGSAGTGKSQVLRAMVGFFRTHQVCTDVLAPTGIAALNVGGKTIHAYAGWSTKAQEYPLTRLKKIAGREKNYHRLSATEVLIIDEISMVSNNTLTRLDAIMRAARRDERPFGGVMVILVVRPVRPIIQDFA